MFHLLIVPAAKGAVAAGHAVAPHIVTAAEAIHVHATAAAAHPVLLNTAHTVQAQAVRAGHSLSVHAGRSVAKRMVVEGARHGVNPARLGAVLPVAPTGHHAVARAVGKAVRPVTTKRVAEFGGTLVASEAFKRLSRTPTGAAAIDRAMGSAPARHLADRARGTRAGDALGRTELGARLLADR